MVKVVHEFRGKQIEGKTDIDNFVLSNNSGGYIALSTQPFSKHQGFVFYDGLEHFKTINNIRLNRQITKLTNKFTHIQRDYADDVQELTILPEGHNALVYLLNKRQPIEISLDCRKADDMRQFGRYYNIYEEDDNIIVEFIKKTDSSEDQTHDEEEFRLFMIFHPDTGNKTYTKLDQWQEEKYVYEERRQFIAQPRFVYNAIRIDCQQLIVAVGTSKTDAKDQLNNTLKNFDEIVKQENKRKLLNKFFKQSWKSETDFAKLAAINSLLTLRQDATYHGIYAGFYWFRQFWSRDELISLKGFINIGSYRFVKTVLFRWLEMIQEDGRLPDRYPMSDLASADSIGWLFKRIDDFINALEKSRCLSRYLSFEDLVFIKNKGEKAVYSLLENYSDGPLIKCGMNETWMDTVLEAGVPRAGAIIEIQALQLALYKTLKRLCKLTDDRLGVKIAASFERELRYETRREFWNGNYLKDGPGIDIIRPNIFIVYYVYPDLLSKVEWTKCFDHILPKLWLSWGGLSSIDKENPLYQPQHIGEGSISYHQGDSWFWINNLAAYCLKKHARYRYRDKISAIKNASIMESLWYGFPGHHAEISSADKLKSYGCFCQAWSAAMFLELFE